MNRYGTVRRSHIIFLGMSASFVWHTACTVLHFAAVYLQLPLRILHPKSAYLPATDVNAYCQTVRLLRPAAASSAIATELRLSVVALSAAASSLVRLGVLEPLW